MKHYLQQAVAFFVLSAVALILIFGLGQIGKVIRNWYILQTRKPVPVEIDSQGTVVCTGKSGENWIIYIQEKETEEGQLPRMVYISKASSVLVNVESETRDSFLEDLSAGDPVLFGYYDAGLTDIVEGHTVHEVTFIMRKSSP